MGSTKVRTHVLLPKDLLDEIDELVGSGRRSEVIAEAVDAWVVRNRNLRAIRAVKHSSRPEDDPDEWDEETRREGLRRAMEKVRNSERMPGTPPEWDTPEGAAKWVHDLRYTKSARERRIEALRDQPE